MDLVGEGLAGHQVASFVVVHVARRKVADLGAVAQHGDALGDLHHLVETMRRRRRCRCRRASARRPGAISASTSCRVSEAVGSSMMTSLASAAIARQIATSWRSAIEQLLDLRVRIERGADARHRRFSAVCAHRRPIRPSAAAEMLADRDVLGDREVGKQRQVLVDHLDAACGRLHRIRDAGSPGPRSRCARRAPGASTPEMILISVDLPEPFSPTRQCTSPACKRQIDVAQARRRRRSASRCRTCPGMASS